VADKGLERLFLFALFSSSFVGDLKVFSFFVRVFHALVSVGRNWPLEVMTHLLSGPHWHLLLWALALVVHRPDLDRGIEGGGSYDWLMRMPRDVSRWGSISTMRVITHGVVSRSSSRHRQLHGRVTSKQIEDMEAAVRRPRVDVPLAGGLHWRELAANERTEDFMASESEHRPVLRVLRLPSVVRIRLHAVVEVGPSQRLMVFESIS